MAVTLLPGRQELIVAEAAFGFADLTSATAAASVTVPEGAVVVGGYLIIDTVWNSATSDVMDIGDAGDVDRYSATPVDITALGATALDVTGFAYTALDTIDVIWTGVSTAPTTGDARLVVEYYVEGRAAFSEG